LSKSEYNFLKDGQCLLFLAKFGQTSPLLFQAIKILSMISASDKVRSRSHAKSSTNVVAYYFLRETFVDMLPYLVPYTVSSERKIPLP